MACGARRRAVAGHDADRIRGPIVRCSRSSWSACGCSRTNTGRVRSSRPVCKAIGVGVTAFVFDVTRDKLLETHWFERLYELVLKLRAKATELVDPIKRRIRELIKGNGEGWSSRTLRVIQRSQERARRAVSVPGLHQIRSVVPAHRAQSRTRPERRRSHLPTRADAAGAATTGRVRSSRSAASVRMPLM